ncbi:hypothetical protein PHMEG_00015242 [Phytophthora megakarya]|uniref:Uncharacterized protein n=1 Tax=Phytophthora megakarya TaxID=4795 RepID=A0A225W3W3_9STRA|nr:hypothetical protein PHMEG_00015242 [Phytophthora megakarya]
MSTHATPGTTSAPSSPSSRAPTAPTNSESQAAARADVVDVKEDGEPWTETSVRRVSDPPPLRSSNPVAVKSVGEEENSEACSPSGVEEEPRVPAAASASESEEKAPVPTITRLKKTQVPAPEMPSMPDDLRATVTSSRKERFDLHSFLDLFQPGAAVGASTVCSSPLETGSARVEEPASTPEALSLIEELRASKTEVHQLRGFVGAPEGPVAVSASATVANTKSELPPAEVFYLTSGKFKEGEGGLQSPQDHMPAASRGFRTFGSATGKSLSAMSFVLWLRELDCVKFM